MLTGFLIVCGVVWIAGTIAGSIAGLDQGIEDSPYFAVCVFWPIFAVIFLMKGLFKALKQAIND